MAGVMIAIVDDEMGVLMSDVVLVAMVAVMVVVMTGVLVSLNFVAMDVVLAYVIVAEKCKSFVITLAPCL